MACSLATRQVLWKQSRRLFCTGVGLEEFSPKRVVVVRKKTRYEHEKNRERAVLHKPLARIDWNVLEDVYRLQCYAVEELEDFFRHRSVEVRVVQDTDYSGSDVDWADVIFSAGGDGTFLLASNCVRDRQKPVIGLNSDPARSRGFLCLPRKAGDSIVDSLRTVFDSGVRWKLRHRIRVTMDNMPAAMHFDTPPTTDVGKPPMECSSPWLALNDIFIGESLSGHASYLDISVDDSVNYRLKCSGLLTYTGTGSTSWAYNANCQSESTVRTILSLSQGERNSTSLKVSDQLVRQVTQSYNRSLTFDGSDPVLAYYIRDPVQTDLFTVSRPRDVAKRLEILSRCWNARLVVDGRWTFHFNHGSRAQLQLLEEDALRTISIT